MKVETKLNTFETGAQDVHKIRGKFPDNFGNVFAHTQPMMGTIEKNERTPKPYWTYSERADGGNTTITSFSQKLEAGLNGGQLKLLVHYQVLIYEQVGNLSARIDGLHGLEAVNAFYGNTSVLFDVKEYAAKIGKPYKEVNRDVMENLNVLEDRVYHYFHSKKDKDGKAHFFHHEAQVLKVHHEVNKDGKRKKNGLIELEVPANYLYALCDSSPLKSFYYEIPAGFYKLPSKNQTAVKLAARAIERYNQDHGKNGRGYWKLETALDVSGLLPTMTIKKSNGKEIKVSRLSQNLDLFTNAISEITENDVFNKDGTYFLIKDPTTEESQKIELNELSPLYDYCKKHGAKNVYFHFQLKDVEDATRKRSKALAQEPKQAETEIKTVKPSNDNESMDFID